MQSATVIYLKTRLHRDFDENASTIIRALDHQLSTLFGNLNQVRMDLGVKDIDIHNDSAEKSHIHSYQFLLDNLLYPFMACSEAMVQSGMEGEMVKRYVLRLWDELPEKIMNSIMEKAVKGKMNEHINEYLAGVRGGLVIPLFDK